jgi:membrane protein DedA with SNARE-associated domain
VPDFPASPLPGGGGRAILCPVTEHPGPAAEASPRPTPAAPHTPWGEGHPQRADKVILGVMMFVGFYYLATMFLVGPLVGRHPVWLALIRGSTSAVITLGALARTGHGSMTVAVLAGLPGTMAFDWVWWWAGRRWGENALRMAFRGRKAERRIELVKRLGHRYGWLLLVTAYIGPIPMQLIAVAVAMAGMSLPVFLVLDAIGALIWLGLWAGLGYWIGESAVRVADTVSHYSLEVTIVLMVLLILRQARTARRRGNIPAGGSGRGRG